MVIFSATRAFQFAHGALTMLAAYVFLIGLGFVGGSPVAAGVIAIAVMTLVSVVIARFAFEPLLGRHFPSLIVGLGLIVFINELAGTQFYRGQPVPYPSTLKLSGAFDIGGIQLEFNKILVFCISAAAILMLDRFFKRSRMGMEMRALADSPAGAQLCGISVSRTIIASFVVAGLAATLAGVLLGLLQNSIGPTLGDDLTLTVMAAVLVAGPTSFWGAILVSILVALSQTLAVGYLSGSFSTAFSFVMILLVLLLRPNGLFGAVQTRG